MTADLSKQDQVQSLETAKRVLYAFNAFDPKMQVSTILTLIEIAQADVKEEAMSTQDLEKKVGLLSGTATRNIYYWAHGHKDVRGGHEMVSIDFDPNDRRRRSLHLTAKGKAFIRKFLEGVRRG